MLNSFPHFSVIATAVIDLVYHEFGNYHWICSFWWHFCTNPYSFLTLIASSEMSPWPCSLPSALFQKCFVFYPQQVPGVLYTGITWPSAIPGPRPSRCPHPLTSLYLQRSLDMPSEYSTCARPRLSLSRSYSTQV